MKGKRFLTWKSWSGNSEASLMTEVSMLTVDTVTSSKKAVSMMLHLGRRWQNRTPIPNSNSKLALLQSTRPNRGPLEDNEQHEEHVGAHAQSCYGEEHDRLRRLSRVTYRPQAFDCLWCRSCRGPCPPARWQLYQRPASERFKSSTLCIFKLQTNIEVTSLA
ncbi:hypothetical protein CEXT_604291 [Caerostris extrusa]|uniref:Uncharacterized protein n=1 Tax=Caerostris extrusa TaxID=172846 RepID=A0AAV4T9M9_CAEEX|nr:hypothetical protein CEXT_604291 [Caerostris extrusa]